MARFAAVLSITLALLLIVPIVGPSTAGGNPAACPSYIPDGVTIDPLIKARAWRKAKEVADAPMRWKMPGDTIRHLAVLVMPPRILVGMYHPPFDVVDPKTGESVNCEYIEVYLPESEERFVYHVLVHEYLHAIFYRFYMTDAEFAAAHHAEANADGGEAWVQALWPQPEGW